MKPPLIKKLYYSISEVSKIASVKPYVLRYWESEFRQLKPSKNRAGNRIYRNNDIQLILAIKKLLYEEKYTIEGAKKKIRDLRVERNKQTKLSFVEETNEDLIKKIRQGLLDILAILEK